MKADLTDFLTAIFDEVDKSRQTGLCVDCDQPFSLKNVHTDAGWKETRISGMCEDCFDGLFTDVEEE